MPLKWTPLDTEYAQNETEGNRWIRQCPLFFDGTFLYTLVTYHKNNFSSAAVRFVLEKYEIKNDTELHLKEEVTLMRKDDQGVDQLFVYYHPIDIIQRATIAVNRKKFVYIVGTQVQVFDL